MRVGRSSGAERLLSNASAGRFQGRNPPAARTKPTAALRPMDERANRTPRMVSSEAASASDRRADAAAKSCPRVRLRVRLPSGQPDPRFRRNPCRCNDLDRVQEAPEAPKKRRTASRTPVRNRSRRFFAAVFPRSQNRL